MKIYQSKYIPPAQRNSTHKVVSNSTPILLGSDFPALVKEKPKNTYSEQKMNFKQIAENAKDLPDPSHQSILTEHNTTNHSEPKEIYDLTAYVKLQERRKR